eukprot:CAMPEP_0167791718 /NCGR_PEP_ID=MMETSP0111_2-20121227/12103_1 /TAXON_ID=91324 /ORGANISM="Lotharella globosa, Strain CCCM811" /LENGTH=149 /DNA_ID=CAMNT_0007684441 /DNA_START=85 /DNA_END=531 /DNA_ORIENTATION=-
MPNSFRFHALAVDAETCLPASLPRGDFARMLESYGLSPLEALQRTQAYEKKSCGGDPRSELPLKPLLEMIIHEKVNMVVARAKELGLGSGRVSSQGLNEALGEQFDEVSVKRHEDYLKSMYGSPLCDEELQEWAELPGSTLLSIVVYAW